MEVDRFIGSIGGSRLELMRRETFSSRLINQDQGVSETHPAGGNGRIALKEAGEHRHFFRTGGQPKNPPRPMDQRIGESHSATPLIDSREGDIGISHLEYGIPRNQRGGMPVRTETEVDEVEHRG